MDSTRKRQARAHIDSTLVKSKTRGGYTISTVILSSPKSKAIIRTRFQYTGSILHKWLANTVGAQYCSVHVARTYMSIVERVKAFGPHEVYVLCTECRPGDGKLISSLKPLKPSQNIVSTVIE